MFRRKRKRPASDDLIPVPASLPPIAGMVEEERRAAARGRRTWLWTLAAALVVVLLAVYVLVLGVLGAYDGMKDRTVVGQQRAREHYSQGVTYLESGAYELAIGEFEEALRDDASLGEALTRLQQAKELAQAQARPTSETTQNAAQLLYRQAVAHYESGNLGQAVAVLDEVRGLDPNYQRENVELMLTTSHRRLGLDAVAEDRLDDAAGHFEAVLAVKPDDADAQDQLNLIRLYTAALNYWERDWAATIQALKGLYTLAPDYKDVKARLRDAYLFRAQTYADHNDWCRAADDYAAAVEILPLEATVDQRDDATIRCQSAAEIPTPTPTNKVAAQPTASPTAAAQATSGSDSSPTGETPAPKPTATPQTGAVGSGRIAFTSYDAARQRSDIYVVDLAEGDAKLLRENGSQPAFAAGGKRLAFRNLDPEYRGLGILDTTSGDVGELTAFAEDSTPAWSPAADQIIFSSNKHGDRQWRLYGISPGEVRGDGEQWAFGQMPAWSPDGDQIAYHGCDERGDNCGVWQMSPGGFAPTRLTTDPSDTAPAWSPDGARVAFISVRSGNWDLYLADVASGQVTQLTDHAAADVAPTWSPDGKQIAFLSSREGAWAVYVLEVESGAVQKVIATGDAYPDPVSERLSWVP